MSQVKFEQKETIRTTTGGKAASSPPAGKEDFAHRVGEAITKGGSPDGYLAVSTKHVRDAGKSEC